jgi:hypothetical protein
MNISWNISRLDCYPEQGGLTDVVSTIYWQCNGVDGDYFVNPCGTVEVKLNPKASYTPYAELTQEQILGWVWANGVDKEAVELQVIQKIESLKNPVVSPTLPWAIPTEFKHEDFSDAQDA